MNRENIIAMAKKSRLAVYGLGVDYTKFDDALERFAKLVAQHEREACVKAIEEQIGWDMDDPESTAIKAIRTRGEA